VALREELVEMVLLVDLVAVGKMQEALQHREAPAEQRVMVMQVELELAARNTVKVAVEERVAQAALGQQAVAEQVARD